MDTTNILKELLGIDLEDKSKDVFVQFALREAEEMVLNYCNLENLPEGLQATLLRMAIDFYRFQNLGSQEESQGIVTSIKEGDTSINFAGTSDFKNSILGNYKAQLNRYRKVGW